MSEEYLDKSGAVWVGEVLGEYERGGFQTPDGKEWVVPPVWIDSGKSFLLPGESVWMWFPGILPPMGSELNPHQFVFNDYQIVYDPVQFLQMEGHPWQTFRKNIRKYPARCGGELFYGDIGNIAAKESINHFIANLILEWSNGREVYDRETLIRFALFGERRKGLFILRPHTARQLVGLNVWDENWKYVNFRYCMDDGSPFLQEYLRYCFYTDLEIRAKGKLVNDGGALGSEDLLRFKMKLNPVQILRVYSARPKGTE